MKPLSQCTTHCLELRLTCKVSKIIPIRTKKRVLLLLLLLHHARWISMQGLVSFFSLHPFCLDLVFPWAFFPLNLFPLPAKANSFSYFVSKETPSLVVLLISSCTISNNSLSQLGSFSSIHRILETVSRSVRSKKSKAHKICWWTYLSNTSKFISHLRKPG